MSVADGYADRGLLSPTHARDETRPLLAGTQDTIRCRAAPTPLPRGQLTILCAIRLSDPISFTQILPYVNEMMENFGVATNPSQTGFYSGLVESVFAFAQVISIYQWASLSDRIGRRPVVLAGTIGIAMSTILLGFSRTLTGVLIARSLAGLFSGNVAVMHSVLGELTDSTNQALAYPIYGLCWPLGVIIGPLIGGIFSNPAQKYPAWFNNALFRDFPYLLPCLVVASLTFISVFVGLYYLKETLPRKVRTRKDYSISFGVVEHRDHLLTGELSPSARDLLRLPVMRALCASGCALSFLGTAFDVVFILFCYSPVPTGGLGFSVSQIGFALAIAGISSAAIQIILMPILLRVISCARLYKLCMGLWPFTFVCLPLLNYVAKIGFDGTNNLINERVRLSLWVGIGIMLAISRVACLAFSLNMILVKEFAPGPSSLGTANGLAQFAQCLARAIAPAFVSSLFALSVDYNLLGGHLWMVIMFVISCLSWAHSATVSEGSGDVDVAKAFDGA